MGDCPARRLAGGVAFSRSTRFSQSASAPPDGLKSPIFLVRAKSELPALVGQAVDALVNGLSGARDLKPCGKKWIIQPEAVITQDLFFAHNPPIDQRL